MLTASTGVIGVPLDAAKITHVLPGLAASLDAVAWPEAARAICTTDTFPKGAVRSLRDRRPAGEDRGHRQGLGHDRAEHGHHAGLRRHRRRRGARRAAGDAVRRHRAHLEPR